MGGQMQCFATFVQARTYVQSVTVISESEARPTKVIIIPPALLCSRLFVALISLFSFFLSFKVLKEKKVIKKLIDCIKMMMENKKSRRRIPLFVFLMVLLSSFQSCFSVPSQPSRNDKTTQIRHRFASSAVLPLTGNVYPLGYYSVVLNIGNPPKAFDLDVDTGSDLTWIQCDAPCKGCTKPNDQLYKPKRNSVMYRSDALCSAVQTPDNYHCLNPDEQCDYQVEYADYGSSLGVLLMDYLSVHLVNGSLVRSRIAFGCGYDLQNPGPHPPPPTSGILGLGPGKASLVSQLQATGIMKNVVGHCLSRAGGGFLLFGDIGPSPAATWTPMTHSSSETHYSSGPAKLMFDGKPTGIEGLELVFDSGSSYTYFNAKAYESTVNLVKKNLVGKPWGDAPEDKTLPNCWKGSKPVESILEIKHYFKPLALSFSNGKNVQLRLMPEDYLIVSKDGNACLGILNGSQQGLGNLNVIGDIFFQEKLIIYDNEKQRIGWFPTSCNKLLNEDGEYNEGTRQDYAAYPDMPEGFCPSTYGSEKFNKFTATATAIFKKMRQK